MCTSQMSMSSVLQGGAGKCQGVCRGPNKAEKKQTKKSQTEARQETCCCLLSHIPTIFPRLLKPLNHLHLAHISCLCINTQLAHIHIMKSYQAHMQFWELICLLWFCPSWFSAPPSCSLGFCFRFVACVLKCLFNCVCFYSLSYFST